LDRLQSIREYHRAIVNGDEVFIVGGFGEQYTEIWSKENNSYNIKLASPKVNDFRHYPELLLVDPNFCVKK